MKTKYMIDVTYFSGRRKGQTISISGIDNSMITEILSDITQDQLANSEIVITTPSNKRLFYEDFVLFFLKSQLELH